MGIVYKRIEESGEFPFWTWFGNSIKIASITSVISLAITTVAAYAFSRFRFRGRRLMLNAILLIQVFPALLALVATFLMISQIGDVFPSLGLNTHASLILVYLGGAMGINIWLMKGFLDTIPRDIDEDARDLARSLVGTPAFEQSRRDRKKVEMSFAHLKRNFGLGRLRLRGPSRNEFRIN